PYADSRGAGGRSWTWRQRHAQRRFSQARRRSHRVSEIFTGILCALRPGSRCTRGADSGGLLRYNAGGLSRHGRSRQIVATLENPSRRAVRRNRVKTSAGGPSRARESVLETTSEKGIQRLLGN